MNVAVRLPDPSLPLDAAEAGAAFAAILDGHVGNAEIADFLSVMTGRDETSDEIAAAAGQLRLRMLPVAAPADAIDVCGTGGDGLHSLNISTAVAIVVASCGVPVAKHGNRAASSKAGAADTLEALGLDLDRASVTAEATLTELGIAFLFAQKHHPVLARLAAVRKAIGRRTIFNLLGPLANPAGVKRQLIGVARVDYLPTVADALDQLGIESGLVVAGEENIDELSIAGPSWAVGVGMAQASGGTVTPDQAGLPRHDLGAIRGGDAGYNAGKLDALLRGEASAYRDAVLLNAAGALIVAGRASDWTAGADLAAEAIDAGRAKLLLDRWIAF